MDNISINQINDYTNVYKDYDISNNITTNKMSKYEYTKVLGMRAQQITGADPLINVTDDMKMLLKLPKKNRTKRLIYYCKENKQ